MNGTPTRTRVLFLISDLEPGGAQRVMLTVLQQIDRARFEPHLALLEKRGTLLADLPPDVAVHDLRARRVRYAMLPFIRCVRQLRPQAVLGTLPAVNLMLLACKPFLPRETRLLVRPSVLTRGLQFEESHPTLRSWLSRRLYPRAHRVICASDAMCRDLAQEYGVPPARLVRIYNPVDRERLCELARRGENPFTGNGPHLVAAGRLTRQKGFDVLLDAMGAVRNRVPGVTLTILGDGPLRDELTAQRERLHLTTAVQLPGQQDNPWSYFLHAQALVLSSRYEGLPNVVLETLALGTPVVATECMGAIQEIREHSDRVFVVPVEDAGALAEKLIEVCSRPKPSPANAALTGFGLDESIRQYEKVLLE